MPKRIGVNIDDLLVSQPDTGEQGLEIAELLIRSGALDVVASRLGRCADAEAEIEGEMGDTHVGLQARLMSQALRKLAGTLNRTDTICLFTNQLREKIGVMFGNPETTPGGRALKFYSSVRLDIRRIETLEGRRRGDRQPRTREGGRRTRSRRRSSRPSSTSSTARASRGKERCSTRGSSARS